jgi:hypothetical protein
MDVSPAQRCPDEPEQVGDFKTKHHWAQALAAGAALELDDVLAELVMLAPAASGPGNAYAGYLIIL